jgi:PAS domain S-box-containing protein
MFRLRTKITLICVAIFFLAIGASTVVNGIYFTREYYQARESETFVIAQTLKSQLDRLLKMHIPLTQLVGFEEICRELTSKYAFLSYAMVVDPRGKILFHNDPAQHNRVISDSSLLHHIAAGRKNSLLFHANGEAFYDFLIPVSGRHEEHIATIRIGFPRLLISEKTITSALYSSVVTLLSFCIGIILIVVLLDLWVSKPVGRFIGTIEEIRKGRSTAGNLVEIDSRDELGQLARAFNEMTEELEETTVSKEFMDTIIENMLNSLIIVDHEFRIQAVNQETLNLLAYPENELLGAPMAKVLAKPTQPEAPELAVKPLVEPMRAVERVYLSKTGEEIPVLFSSSILQTGDRESRGFVCVAQDITEVKTLRGFIPICSVCKKIRDDTGYWNQIESYIKKHSTAQFSHSMCPDCVKEMYGQKEWFVKGKSDDTS